MSNWLTIKELKAKYPNLHRGTLWIWRLRGLVRTIKVDFIKHGNNNKLALLFKLNNSNHKRGRKTRLFYCEDDIVKLLQNKNAK